MVKGLILAALIAATPVAAQDMGGCLTVADISEKIASMRDDGVSRDMALVAIPMNIPPDDYSFFVQLTVMIYSDWRYMTQLEIGTMVYRACMGAMG